MRAAWRRLWAGAWALLRRRQWERDLQAEVESMAALAAEAQPRRGRVAMAGSEAAREWTRASGWEYWAANFARDVGYGARGLRRTPATTAVIVLTLALGIGGSCLAFAWVYAGTLRPLPFAQSQRLVWVSSAARGVASAGMSGPVLRDGQARLNAIFDEYALFRGEGDTTWRVGSAAWEASTRKVDGRFFGLLGVHALAGRLLSPSDAAAGHGAVVVLSYDFWRRHFGGNLAVLGRSMNEWEGDYPSYTIVGVLPPSFEWEQTADLWLPEQPLGTYLAGLRGYHPFHLVGRLRQGMSLASAQAGMNQLAQEEAAAHPKSDGGWRIELQTLSQHEHGGGARGLLWLWAAAGCLLLIACVNAAHLLLARGRARQGEIALRLALGASRGRVMAQVLIESVLLAGAGAALGWAAAAAGLRLLAAWGGWLLPAAVLREMVGLHAAALAPWVVAYTAGVAGLVVLLSGLAPAMQSTRVPLRGEASGVGVGATRHRMASSFVATEVALTTLLVIGAGLLLHGWLRLANVNPGFERTQRVSFLVQLPQPMIVGVDRSANQARLQQQAAWWQELENRLRAVPGVAAAGAANDFPLLDDSGGWIVVHNGKTLPEMAMSLATPGYFGAIGAPIVAGSDFNVANEQAIGAKTIILNQALAALLFPGQNPVGKRIALPRCGLNVQAAARPGPAAQCVIIGVARDIRYDLAKPVPPTFYYSIAQDPPLQARFVVVARGNLHTTEVEARAALAGMPSVGTDAPYILQFETLQAGIRQVLAGPRLQGWLAGLLAGLALLLAAVGIFGVASYSVVQRTKEFGVRLALGATRGQVLGLVAAGSARWTLLGIGLGMAGGAVAARLLATRLAGLSPWDPVTMIAAPMLLLAVSLLASLAPARRATRVDPAAALRAE